MANDLKLPMSLSANDDRFNRDDISEARHNVATWW